MINIKKLEEATANASRSMKERPRSLDAHK